MLKIVSKKINRADKKVLFELNNLLKQWSPKRKPINAGRFRELIKKSCLIGLFDGKRLIGTVTLIEMNKVSGRKGSIEHLIVNEKSLACFVQLLDFIFILTIYKNHERLFGASKKYYLFFTPSAILT